MPAQSAKGNLVKVEIATAMVEPIAAHQPTAVSKAYPAVATFPVGHGLAVGMGVVLEVASGMQQLNGIATRISALATNDATLQDIDTVGSSDWTVAAGNRVLVAQTWGLLGEAIGFRLGTGSAGNQLEDARLHLNAPLTSKGSDPAPTAEFDLRDMTYFEGALAAIRLAARRNSKVFLRITHPDGATRHMYGEVSMPGEDLTAQNLGTSGFTLSPAGSLITVGEPIV